MNRSIAAVLTAMMCVMLLCSAAMAESVVLDTEPMDWYYTVQKGETLSRIGKGLKIRWPYLSKINHLKNPNRIEVGQTLLLSDKLLTAKELAAIIDSQLVNYPIKAKRPAKRMPEKPEEKINDGIFRWTKVGGAPLNGKLNVLKVKNYNFKKIAQVFNLNPEEEEEFRQKVLSFDWKYAQIKPVYDENGKPVVQYKRLTFSHYRYKDNVAPAWPSGKPEFGLRVTLSTGRVFDLIIKCGNIGERIPVPIGPIAGPPREAAPGIVPGKADEGTPFIAPPAEAAAEKECPNCNDVYVGGGYYESAKSGHDADGWYSWAKVRYRPFTGNLTDNLKYCIGGFGYGGYGKGHDEDFDYKWYEYFFGPSFKLIDTANFWDSDLDIGVWGRLHNEGDMDLYHSEQDDKTFNLAWHVNWYGRRVMRKVDPEISNWFPKVEGDFQWRYSYDDDQDHDWNGEKLPEDSNNEDRWEIFTDIKIYDIEMSEAFMLTPGLNLGFGRIYGQDDEWFVQGGPNVVMSMYERDFMKISFLNYKDVLNSSYDQYHWISGWLSPSEILEAYRAHKIRTATPEEIEARAAP